MVVNGAGSERWRHEDGDEDGQQRLGRACLFSTGPRTTADGCLRSCSWMLSC